MGKLTGKKLNNSLLPSEEFKRYELPTLNPYRGLAYEDFITNNWLVLGSRNKVLLELHDRGGAVWGDHAWGFYWRLEKDGKIYETDSVNSISLALTRALRRSNKIAFREIGRNNADVYPNELLQAVDEFTPFALSEFYYKGNTWFRTSFIPTDYIMKKYTPVGEPTTILKLINNLANNKDAHFDWFINWIAGFFQTLQKSQVALVLRGDQGSGKGLLFNYVLTPLFGDKHCIAIDNSNLESEFKNWIDEKLFLNLNEIAVDMKERRGVKNFLKQLITDPNVNIQTKFKDFKETRVYSNILITSNEVFPIEIEINDRRFTVFSTGAGLKSQGWDTTQTVKDIQHELPAFAKFLHEYQVDWELYNKALDTPEKQAIIAGTTSNMRKFAYAIVSKDLDFFDDLKDCGNSEYSNMYEALEQYFSKNRIPQSLLPKLFNAMFDINKSSRKVIFELAGQMPEVFGKHKLIKSNGSKYYELIN